jgi:hypothetical protein
LVSPDLSASKSEYRIPLSPSHSASDVAPLAFEMPCPRSVIPSNVLSLLRDPKTLCRWQAPALVPASTRSSCTSLRAGAVNLSMSTVDRRGALVTAGGLLLSGLTSNPAFAAAPVPEAVLKQAEIIKAGVKKICTGHFASPCAPSSHPAMR